jgi:hypothetical protein
MRECIISPNPPHPPLFPPNPRAPSPSLAPHYNITRILQERKQTSQISTPTIREETTHETTPSTRAHLNPPLAAQYSFPPAPASQPAGSPSPCNAPHLHLHLPLAVACLPARLPAAPTHTHPHLRRSPHPACAPLQLSLCRPGTQGGATTNSANHPLPTTLVAGGATCMCMPAAGLPVGDHRATGTGGWDCPRTYQRSGYFLG